MSFFMLLEKIKKYLYRIKTNKSLKKVNKFFSRDEISKNQILELKDLYVGQRCFLIGNGPSLSGEDLDKIKDEKSFSSNKIFSIFNKTIWRPYFYIIADQSYCETINALDIPAKKRLVGLETNSKPLKMYMNNREDVILYHKETHLDEFRKPLISLNCEQAVFGGHTVLFEAFEFAVYMGFKEIVLLGVDCDYSLSNTHFYGDNSANYDYSQTTDDMLKAWLAIKEFSENNGIQIYNASRGGKLDFFERISLDNYL